MAKEPRLRRRLLSGLLLDAVDRTKENSRFARIALPDRHGSPYYVFISLDHPSEVSYDDYRTTRRELLIAACKILKTLYPDALDIVGIATESSKANLRSEDVVYLDVRNWEKEKQDEAIELRKLTELFTNVEKFGDIIKEYPD